MDRASFLDLYDHMAWADAEVWRAVLACDAAARDTRVRELLRHVHAAQRLYLRVWRGEPADAACPEFETLPELYAWASAYYGEAREFVAACTDRAIEESMPEAWLQRLERLLGPAAGPVTVGDTLVQVPLHTQHHRGQVCALLSALGGKPPLVDYVAWVWRGRPAAVWGELAEQGDEG